MASNDCTICCLPIETLEAGLSNRPYGRTPEKLALLDIGTFPSIPSPSTRDILQRPPDGKLRFVKWIHRTNNSDLALITLQNDSGLKY